MLQIFRDGLIIISLILIIIITICGLIISGDYIDHRIIRPNKGQAYDKGKLDYTLGKTEDEQPFMDINLEISWKRGWRDAHDTKILSTPVNPTQ